MRNEAEFLTAAQVRVKFGVSKLWIERRMKTAGFPHPVTFGTTRRYWRVADIDAWIIERASR
jgi:predicted DNA-binding transcriptional regulator AlpA